MRIFQALTVVLGMLAPMPTLAQVQTLTGGDWQVADLPGIALPPDATPTLSFSAEGRVAGHSGCNRFTGGWAQDGLQLTFTAMATTRMACDPARMEVEDRMLAALGAVTTLALTPGGALELLGSDGLLLLRATR